MTLRSHQSPDHVNAQGRVAVVGAGLAGCEAALALTRFGLAVTLFEQKPLAFSPAHQSPLPAELVCSNSLRSNDTGTAVGLLKQEMRELGSRLMAVADATSVPAGSALAVDRERFSQGMAAVLSACPAITMVNRVVESLDDPCLSGFQAVIICAGPLAAPELAESIAQTIGGDGLYFYDAIAPVIEAESIDMDIAFWANRHDPEAPGGDYLNLPLNKEEYLHFVEALKAATRVPPRNFEKEIHFEGCLPIEAMVDRGDMTLAFGPLKPIGMIDPRTGRRPFACVQLRRENAEGQTLNMVGFQTKLTHPEQLRVFRMLPGLANARFERLGSIHRNTYVDAPKVLRANLELAAKPGFYLAGQITGVEGYVESAACGLWAGLSVGAALTGGELALPPAETALGALLRHLQTPPVKRFSPSNVIFGLFPPLTGKMRKAARKQAHAERGRAAFAQYLEELTLPDANTAR